MPDMPGWSQIVTLSRCGCLRDGVHGPVIAPGMPEPLKEARSAAGQDLLYVPGFLFCALPWGCCSLSMATSGLEPFQALLSCGTLLCPSMECTVPVQVGAHPRVHRRMGWTVKTQ